MGHVGRDKTEVLVHLGVSYFYLIFFRGCGFQLILETGFVRAYEFGIRRQFLHSDIRNCIFQLRNDQTIVGTHM